MTSDNHPSIYPLRRTHSLANWLLFSHADICQNDHPGLGRASGTLLFIRFDILAFFILLYGRILCMEWYELIYLCNACYEQVTFSGFEKVRSGKKLVTKNGALPVAVSWWRLSFLVHIKMR